MAARRRRVLVDVGGSSQEARREIQKVREEVRRLGREQVEARIDVNERVVLAKIQRVQDRLQRLKSQEASPEVDIKVAAAYAQLDRLNLRLDRLRAKRINIDVDVRRGAVETAISGFRRLETTSNRVGQGISRSFRSVPLVGAFLTVALDGARALITGLSAIPSIVGGIASVFIGAFQTIGDTIRGLVQGTTSLGSVFASMGSGLLSVGSAAATAVLSLAATAAVAGALIIAVNAVIGAIIALTGALVALVASLAAAVAGLGALGVALAAALGPAVIVLIGLFTRFAAILKARQAGEQQLSQAVQEQKTAEQQRKDALDASKQAHEHLAQATVEGNHAMAQSFLDLRDAQLGLQSSKLGVKEAQLSLKEAKKALADFRRETETSGTNLNDLFKRATDVATSPAQQRALVGDITSASGGKADPLELQRRILAVQRAQLNVKEAINQTAHAESNLATATQKRGDFVKRGIRAYAPYRQALEQVRKADERAQRAQDQTTAAQRKYQQALQKLSPTERGALSRLNQIIDAFNRLAKAFTDPIFKAMNDVFDSLKGKGGFLKDALTEVGTAMGDVVRAFGDFLAKPETREAFKRMADGAATLVRELGGKAFISFLTIMQQIAVAALPAVISAARRLSGWLGRIAGQPGKIRSATQTVIDHFKTWAGLGWQVLRAVAGIFRAASGPGKSLADNLKKIVKHFADWANSEEGQRRLRRFFRDAVEKTKDIVHWIKNAVSWLRDHLPAAAETAKKAFKGVYDIVKKTVDTIGKLGNARRNVEHAVFGTGRITEQDAAASFKAAQKDIARLHTHLSRGERDTTRERLFQTLNRLDKHWGNLSPDLKALLNRLRGITGHASGGPVGGSGRGDRVPIMAEPGEFILRRAVVARLSLPVLHAMNGGLVPAIAPAAFGGDRHETNIFNIPPPLDATKPIDPANAAALLQQAWAARGGGLS